jgi:hypothetical protein
MTAVFVVAGMIEGVNSRGLRAKAGAKTKTKADPPPSAKDDNKMQKLEQKLKAKAKTKRVCAGRVTSRGFA